jgi:hypothetical protein
VVVPLNNSPTVLTDGNYGAFAPGDRVLFVDKTLGSTHYGYGYILDFDNPSPGYVRITLESSGGDVAPGETTSSLWQIQLSGVMGPTGKRGTIIFAGYGTPPGMTGMQPDHVTPVIGDFFFDINTSNLYYNSV